MDCKTMSSCKMPLVAALLCAMLGFAHACAATSCRPRTERYYLSCRDGVCEVVFRVAEIDAFGVCGRRSDVRETEAATNRFLAPLVGRAKPQATGLFELKFPNMYWYSGPSPDAVNLLGVHLERALSAGERPRSLASMRPDEVVALLGEAYGDQWIAQISPDPSLEAVRTERRRMEDVADGERWLSASLWMAYWGSASAAWIALIYSILLFFSRLHSIGAKRPWSLLAPMAIQVAIGAAGIGSLAAASLDPWPGALLLPAVATVLLAEGWAGLRRSRAG